MRTISKWALPLLLLATCKSSSTPSQVLLGFASTLAATDEIDRVELIITRYRDGLTLSAQEYDLSGIVGKDFALPSSSDVFDPNNANTRVKVVVAGYKGTSLLMARRSIFSVLTGHQLFNRMGLLKCNPACPTTLDASNQPVYACLDGACVKNDLVQSELAGNSFPIDDPRPYDVMQETPPADDEAYTFSDVNTLLKTISTNGSTATIDDLLHTSQCAWGGTLIDSSSHQPFNALGMSCPDDQYCSYGICNQKPTAAASTMTSNSGGWNWELSGESRAFNAIYALPTGEAYAVGAGGAIYHRADDNAAWEKDSFSGTGDLYSVTAGKAVANGSTVWWFGGNGVILTRNGSGTTATTTALQIPNAQIYSLSLGLTPNNAPILLAGGSTGNSATIYLVPLDGLSTMSKVIFYDNSTTPTNLDIQGKFTAIQVANYSAVGVGTLSTGKPFIAAPPGSGTLSTTSQWAVYTDFSKAAPTLTHPLYAVYAPDGIAGATPPAAYVAGDDGIFTFAWTATTGLTMSQIGAGGDILPLGLRALSGKDQNDFFAAGVNGEVFHFDGSPTLTVMPIATSLNINGVTSNLNNVTIVGASGLLATKFLSATNADASANLDLSPHD